MFAVALQRWSSQLWLSPRVALMRVMMTYYFDDYWSMKNTKELHIATVTVNMIMIASKSCYVACDN